mmetsp:Transcript_49373/g.119742  ORF Transcript_49373/g.119742 Transcript_49373/m.119742 type:complete len:86 (+) Transcript_49373:1792-2049(+)
MLESFPHHGGSWTGMSTHPFPDCVSDLNSVHGSISIRVMVNEQLRLSFDDLDRTALLPPYVMKGVVYDRFLVLVLNYDSFIAKQY